MIGILLVITQESTGNKKRAEFKKFFGTVENFQKARTGSYDYKKLRSELKDMSDIIKTTNSRFKSLLTY
jgi:hypothetical protein